MLPSHPIYISIRSIHANAHKLSISWKWSSNAEPCLMPQHCNRANNKVPNSSQFLSHKNDRNQTNWQLYCAIWWGNNCNFSKWQRVGKAKKKDAWKCLQQVFNRTCFVVSLQTVPTNCFWFCFCGRGEKFKLSLKFKLVLLIKISKLCVICSQK